MEQVGNKEKTYVNTKNPVALNILAEKLYALIKGAIENGYRSIVFLCIGTDRSTGDSLGPLVGYKINGLAGEGVFVYGTLEKPVHAKNIETTMKEIRERCPFPYIVAVDACLGTMEHVGYIAVGKGAIKPGAGVKKELEPVGHMHVTGIVNFGGFMDFFILQNTRLGTVMKMADIVSAGIRYAVRRMSREYSA